MKKKLRKAKKGTSTLRKSGLCCDRKHHFWLMIGLLFALFAFGFLSSYSSLGNGITGQITKTVGCATIEGEGEKLEESPLTIQFKDCQAMKDYATTSFMRQGKTYYFHYQWLFADLPQGPYVKITAMADLASTPEGSITGANGKGPMFIFPDEINKKGRIKYVVLNDKITLTVAPWCSDKFVEGTEQCDDGNYVGGDGCNLFCQKEFCGDGELQVKLGEVCDDNNDKSDDGCSAACNVEPNYECKVGGVLCTKVIPPPQCGNNQLEKGEQCDDGNILFDDGCSSSCKIEKCGDNIVQPKSGEECDDGNGKGGDGCSGQCKKEFCGDGKFQEGLGEQCDDGAQNHKFDGTQYSNYGCSEMCKTEKCGDTVVQTNEQCDDGNNDWKDTCTPLCKSAVCGDGFLQVNEECDDGGSSNPGCSEACKIAPGYECTQGEGHICSKKAKMIVCGDGLKEGSEECDDNNVNSADGCSATCQVEAGFLCSADGQACTVIKNPCGNRQLDQGEQCDDENSVAGDGCSSSCQLEESYSCLVPQSEDSNKWGIQYKLLHVMKMALISSESALQKASLIAQGIKESAQAKPDSGSGKYCVVVKDYKDAVEQQQLLMDFKEEKKWSDLEYYATIASNSQGWKK